MAITKASKKAVEAFIEAAPDAKPARWQRGTKTQVTLSVSPSLLAEVDEVARQKHLNRSAILTLWIGEALARERRSAAA